MCIVEIPSVVVSVHCECPAAGLPYYRTIEVGECHILVVLPAVQHKAEVCVTTIPPDAEDYSVGQVPGTLGPCSVIPSTSSPMSAAAFAISCRLL